MDRLKFYEVLEGIAKFSKKPTYTLEMSGRDNEKVFETEPYLNKMGTTDFKAKLYYPFVDCKVSILSVMDKLAESLVYPIGDIYFNYVFNNTNKKRQISFYELSKDISDDEELVLKREFVRKNLKIKSDIHKIEGIRDLMLFYKSVIKLDPKFKELHEEGVGTVLYDYKIDDFIKFYDNYEEYLLNKSSSDLPSIKKDISI